MKKNNLSFAKLAVIIGVFMASPVAAQEVMTLHQCMEYALDNSARIIEQLALNEDATMAKREALLKIVTPGVSASVSAGINSGRSLDENTNGYTTVNNFQNSLSLSAGYTLFNGFSLINNYRIARISERMGKSQENLIRDEICLSTIQAYYNTIYYKRMIEIYQSQVESANEAMRLADKQRSIGLKSDADVIQIQADLADKEYNLTLQHNNYNDALLTLKQLMLYPVEKELEIDCNVAMAESSDYESLETEQITDNALDNLPSIKLTESAVRKAELNLQSSRWSLLPSLQLSGSIGSGYFSPIGNGQKWEEYSPQIKNKLGKSVSVSMSIPIFSQFSRQGNIKSKRNAVHVAEVKHQKQMSDIEAEVLRAVQDRNGSQAAFIGAEKRLNAQQAAYQVSMKKYEQGLVSALDLQTVSDRLLNSQAEHLNMMLKLELNSRIVDYYNGVPYIEQQ